MKCPGSFVADHARYLAGLTVAGLVGVNTALAATVTVYGRIDTGLLYTANQNDSANSLQLRSGFSSGSRFGLKGHESLGEGWHIGYVLESGFTADDGTLTSTNTLFSRQSTITVSNKQFGELAFGRSGKPLSGSDQYTRIRSFLPFGVTYGDAGLLFYGKGGRIDNAIFYESPTLGGFTAQLAGSLQTKGQEETHWADNDRFLGGTVDWKRGDFGIMVGAERIYQSRENHADNNNADPTTYFLGLSYDFGVVKLLGAYQRGEGLDRIGSLSGIKFDGKSAKVKDFDADSWMLGAMIPAGAGTVRLSGLYVQGSNSQDIYSKKAKGSVGKDAGYWAVAAGYTYPLSKRTNVYGVISHLQGIDALDTDSYSVTNSDGDLRRNQIAVGLVHKF